VKLFLFDDRRADAWRPFALTRPIGEIRFGARTLRARIEDWTGQLASGSFTRPWLSQFSEPGSPPALPRGPAPANGDLLLMCSRFVPHDEAPFPSAAAAGAPVVFVCRDQIAGCMIPARGDAPDASWMLDPTELAAAKTIEVPGRMLDSVWNLIEFGHERLHRDVRRIAAQNDGGWSPAPGVHVLGDGPVIVGQDVDLEPGVVLDTRQGGVVLGDRSEVRSGSRVAGPFVADTDCRLLGGSLAGVSAGVRSYLRGEIEETTTFGYVNKAHDGFIGHAVIGRWVNLGALTTNSDLKNTYGSVSLGDPDGPIDTGLLKLGCLLGDHVKTAIGTLFTTGTVVGAGASVFGDRSPERWVAPFSWGNRGRAGSYDVDRFLTTADRVFQRRGVEASDQVRAWLSACRQQAIDEADAG